MKHIIADLRMS